MYDCCLYMIQERNYLFQLEVNADNKGEKKQKKKPLVIFERAWKAQSVLEDWKRKE